MCCSCIHSREKDANSSPTSRCLITARKGCFRFFDENKPYIFFALLIFSVFVIFSRNTEIFLESLRYLQGLNEGKQIALFVALFVFVSQPISWGYIVLNVSAGFLYGFIGGIIVVCVSSSIGISTVHFANRVCFKQCLSKVITKLPQRVTPMMDLLKTKHAFKLVLLSRLTPLPFGLMNAFFAVSEVSNCNYIVASVLGLLPTQAINAYIGTTLRSIEEVTSSRHNKSYYIILIFQIAACFLVSSLVVRLANQNLDSKLQQVTTSGANNSGGGNNGGANVISNGGGGSKQAVVVKKKQCKQSPRVTDDEDDEDESDDDEGDRETKELLGGGGSSGSRTSSSLSCSHKSNLSSRPNGVSNVVFREDMV
ncbi:transmembrane protein 64-like [Symsagittifera roscoffensis]|uniref:transmembrane protein 64-like n=1 Tax=Symsagittifera roscoffensis TaxID=84072 RepID=UPI00307B45CC